MVPYISRIGKSTGIESRMVVARVVVGQGGEKGEELINEYRVYFWGDKNVFELDKGSGCTTL